MSETISGTQNALSLTKSDMTMTEAMESLNYFELQAVKKEFHIGLSDLETDPEAFAYALVWIIERRNQAKLPAKVIQEQPLKILNDYFQPEDLDQTEDSEQGKESTPVS